MSDAAAQLARLAGTGNGRGVEDLVPELVDDFRTAVAELRSATNVTIATGFTITRAKPPAAETDGPLGVAVLSAILGLHGASVTVVCDVEQAPVVNAGLREIAPAANVVAATDADFSAAGIVTEGSLGLAAARASHLVFVERVGPGADGRCRNMRSDVIDEWSRPLYRLISASSAFSIGVGDGGNEIGFGRIPASRMVSLLDEPQIRCVVETDCLVVGGTSNWAAHALACGVVDSAARGVENEHRVALSEESSKRVMAAMIDAGAVDGMSAVASPKVDGLSWADYWRIPQAMNSLL